MTENVTRERDISRSETETTGSSNATGSDGTEVPAAGVSTTDDDVEQGRVDDRARERRIDQTTAPTESGLPVPEKVGATVADGRGASGRKNGVAAEPEGFRRWVAESEAILADADSARIDVYLRSMLPPPGAKDAQLDVLDRLSSVGETSPFEGVDVTVWGERICLCDRCRDTETGRRIVDDVRRFRRWGVEYDASTERFFERTQQRSSLVGSAHEGISPPRVTAALRVDESLQGVFPASFADECYSVHDFSDVVDRLLADDRRLTVD